MMSYNPPTRNIAGEIYGNNMQRVADYDSQAIMAQAQADVIRRQKRQQLISDITGMVGKAGKAAVGFAMGGPAGAAMASGGGGGGGGEGGGGGGDGGVLGSIISSFANKKALDAKDQAYTSFFSKHGKDLGFDPSYLEDLKAMSRDDRLTSFELMTGAPGQRLGSLAYMNNQANLFSGNRGSGGGGGGGGGQQPFYTVQ
jgi:hypothetical protein